MESNRFFEMSRYLEECERRGRRAGTTAVAEPPAKYKVARMQSVWSQPFAAADRSLIVLLDNGGVDLGIPELVDKLLSAVPGAGILPDSFRSDLVEFLREKIKAVTDQLLESAELYVNRYSAAKPDLFGDVVILRDSTSSYDDLKAQLLSLARAGKIIDLFILTHGSEDSISVSGGVNGAKIRSLKAENGGLLPIRAVYMMNCVGSSLNPAWLEAGARVSSGALKNNYLPEPSMFFFWRAWQDGQTFENAVTSAYRKTIAVMNDAVRGFINALPIPGASALANAVDFTNFTFVKDSAPVIQGQRTLTINSDQLSKVQSVNLSLATTVVPARMLSQLAEPAKVPSSLPERASQQAIAFLRSVEAFHARPATNAAGNCVIGYGTYLHEGECDGSACEKQYSAGISETDAALLLEQRAGEVQQAIKSAVTTPLNINQNDALVSFVYSIGIEAFKKSNVLKVLNDGRVESVPDEMMKWVRVQRSGGSIEVPELVKRRQAEIDLFRRPGTSVEPLSLRTGSYVFRYSSPPYAVQQSQYSRAMNPAAAAAVISIADAAQIGLGAVAVIQTQVPGGEGKFTLTFDKAQRLLSTEARAVMPGSVTSKSNYSRQLLSYGIDKWGSAYANVVIDWAGNPYGEIETPIIRRDLSRSSEWSWSYCSLRVTRKEVIPPPKSDPREWPIVYYYEGRFDPLGTGDWEYSGEFEINAFGGLKFNKHEVIARTYVDMPAPGVEYVVKGADVIVPTPTIPGEQMEFLRKRLP